MAYLLGFWLGDGRNAGKEKKVRFKLADRQQIAYVNRLTARLLSRNPKRVRRDGPFYVVDYDTAVLYDYMSQSLARLRGCIWGFKADFLRGFFDAEGYASCHVDASSRRMGYFRVGAANTNRGYLELAKRLLNAMNIESSIRITNRAGTSMTIRSKTWKRKHDVYHVIINGPRLAERFCNEIGFSNSAKRLKLRDLVRAFRLPPEKRFPWFAKQYERRGRRWMKIER